ncbi:hypothetical protein HMPREF0556_12124 [Listeria grayi DSM 20601]|uniref:Uncharacterized protein n=1 Tax=Listeria grayi DSM 20601 TaxID=525367 RepID=D7UYM2_LISGR|nr:hypothetical protein HMPREF0556_12124 [Listeria grayi DSM 20601]
MKTVGITGFSLILMAQMGQKPSQKKINQMMSAMNKQSAQASTKKKSK